MLLGGASGCGYQFVRASGALPEVERVALHGFRNDTLEPGVDSLLGDALSRELLRRGLRLVDDATGADLLLRGVVRELETRGRSFSSLGFALEYEVQLGISVQIERGESLQLSLGGALLEARELYLASADLEVTRSNREEALRRLASVLAARVYDALYERLATPGAP